MTARFELAVLEEPGLEFGYGQRLEHPKDGLLLYGPYRNPFLSGTMRVGLISTEEGAGRYTAWVHRVNSVIPPAKPRDPNHTIFPGFPAVFQAGWSEAPTARITVDADSLARAIRMEDRHQAIYKAVSLYAEPMISFAREQSEVSIDLWVVLIPEDVWRLGRPKSTVSRDEQQANELLMDKKAATRILHQPSLFEADNRAAALYLYEMNFHNQLKARLLEHRIVVQVIRETTLAPDDFKKSNGMPLRQLQDPATVAWNLATTAFFKAGGQPWKLGTPRPGVCYVGIVFKRDATGPEETNACCGAQMFLDSGDGVVFRGAVGPWYSRVNEQFHLTQDKARDLMKMVVEAYQRDHGGLAPTELFIHGKTRFSVDEWNGFREAVPSTCQVVCVRIREDLSLKLYRRTLMNIGRGVAWEVSARKAFLWSKGFIPRLQTYPGREVPNPLSIEIVRGEADMGVVTRDVLSLTKLNYNTCIYGDGVPVTLRFADAIGEILTAGPVPPDLPPLPFRYYI
jgi:hypothetical protein